MEKTPQRHSSRGCFLGHKTLPRAEAGDRTKRNDWCRFVTDPQTAANYAKRLAWPGEHLKGGQGRQVTCVGLAGLKAVLTLGRFRSPEMPTRVVSFDCCRDERLQEHGG